ncbi:hypothetical protein BCAR13_940132 [Paraburkholderia caribensis]|nr:hypothetical protein BCAR13_940132 [Paraburkholderia caribensis]
MYFTEIKHLSWNFTTSKTKSRFYSVNGSIQFSVGILSPTDKSRPDVSPGACPRSGVWPLGMARDRLRQLQSSRA